MNQERELSPTATILCGMFAAAMGLILILMGLDVIKPDSKSLHAPLWIATCAGLAFLLAGVSISIRALTGVGDEESDLPQDVTWWVRLVYYLIGLTIVAALAAIGTWVAFGPGPRSFGGSGTLFVPRDWNDIVGRAVFGFGAIVTWFCTVALAVGGARRLFGRRKA
jgi:hypothetical protein